MVSAKYSHEPHVFTFVQLVAASTSLKAPEHHLVFNAEHTGMSQEQAEEDTWIYCGKYLAHFIISL